MTDQPKPSYDELREANAEAVHRLLTQGVAINPIILLQARLDLLMDLVFSHECGPETARRKLEYAYEEKVATFFEEAEQEVLRAKLAIGSQAPQRGPGPSGVVQPDGSIR